MSNNCIDTVNISMVRCDFKLEKKLVLFIGNN